MKIYISSAEKINPNDLEIRIEAYDSYSGWVSGAVVCEYQDRIIGKIDIQINDRKSEIYIDMIEVLPEYRRMGIATQMFNFIKNEYRDFYVDWGFTTTDGTKLKSALTTTVKNPEYENIEKALETVEKLLHDSEEKLDDDAWLESSSQDDIMKVTNRWQKLYDKKRDLLDKLDELREYITTWK